MEAIEVEDWAAFEDQLRKDVYPKLKSHSSRLLFRGQPDRKLATTLERANHEWMSFEGYFGVMLKVKPVLETFTGASWRLPGYGEALRLFEDPDLGFELFTAQADVYAFMVYLRHHGFPSPLLDWSYSPHVAAFFAFHAAIKEGEKVSIYVLCERPEGQKLIARDRAHIRAIGPYVRSDPRHFRQQSDYTICGRFENSWRFSSHEDVFDSRRIGQDLLWKFNFPATARVNILRSLDSYNLNAFSLFDSQEALLETLWLREQVLPSPILS